MEKIYIIKDTSDFVADSELYENIFLTSENLSEDWHFHDFAVKLFKENNPSKLVIPLDINGNTFDGLLLGLHIRLNNDLTHDQKCIPIIFISEKHSFESIFSDPTLSIKQNRALPHFLLTTPNIYLEKPNLDIILAIFELNKPMSIFDYKYKFLDSIKILPSETTGKHSLANIWGAFRLAQTTGHTELLKEKTELLRKQKDLYFKYVSANSGITNSHVLTQKITIDSKQKNILLIDDEANKGWDVVLKAIFDDANFEVVGKKDGELFTPFNKRANEVSLETNSEGLPKWDLILLDLRLNENEDKGENANKLAKDYSGAILLDAVKKTNKGTQVIMFTASNKAWNMRDLIEMGADGFFIKESPEYSQDNGFSLNNYKSFEKQVKECFEKDFLRKIFEIYKKCNDFIKVDKPNRHSSYKKFYERSEASLEIAFELLKKSADDKKYLNLAFLTYYQILEDYSSQRDNFEYNYDRIDGDCVVKKERTPIKIIDGSSKTWELEYVQSNNQHHSFYKRGSIPQSKGDSRQAFPKISFLLAFKFDKNDDYLKEKWSKLNGLRNDKAGHGGDKGFVTVPEIKELLEIVELFLTKQ